MKGEAIIAVFCSILAISLAQYKQYQEDRFYARGSDQIQQGVEKNGRHSSSGAHRKKDQRGTLIIRNSVRNDECLGRPVICGSFKTHSCTESTCMAGAGIQLQTRQCYCTAANGTRMYATQQVCDEHLERFPNGSPQYCTFKISICNDPAFDIKSCPPVASASTIRTGLSSAEIQKRNARKRQKEARKKQRQLQRQQAKLRRQTNRQNQVAGNQVSRSGGSAVGYGNSRKTSSYAFLNERRDSQ